MNKRMNKRKCQQETNVWKYAKMRFCEWNMGKIEGKLPKDSAIFKFGEKKSVKILIWINPKRKLKVFIFAPGFVVSHVFPTLNWLIKE
jgi:hypothetical protein